ncbi:MAG: M48 family metalloprotease [Burkholderiales bacterium]|nr:M48 family metalloprotease [Burkholderiales bacterium]
MNKLLRVLILALGAGAAAPAAALAMAYEPSGLDWSAGEVEAASQATMQGLLDRAAKAGRIGCERHCERIEAIYQRLLHEARQQSPHAAALPWSLTVVRLQQVEAMALPGGQVVVSEAFIDERQLSDQALAFVLAHEMAHSILEHERQALTFARMLLPQVVSRSVQDMYVELDLSLSLLIAMEPVLQQGEFEADELGLLLASAAGYAPERQLDFIDDECAAQDASVKLVATHPPACTRQQQLQARLPLALRIWQLTLPSPRPATD